MQKKLTSVLAAAVVTTGLFLTPGIASARDHGHDGHRWNNSGYHDNGHHHGWYNRSYRQNSNWNDHHDYEYYRGHRGHWDNSSGVRLFINL